METMMEMMFVLGSRREKVTEMETMMIMKNKKRKEK